MIRVGIESSSPEILKHIKKGFTVEQVINTMKMMKKVGMKVHASYVLGLPGSTKKTLEDDIKFAIKQEHDYGQFGMAVPYPGTEMYKEAEEKGWLLTRWKCYPRTYFCSPMPK